MSKRTDSQPKTPKHLSPASRKWWEWVVNTYELEQHHVRLLTHAAEAWDCAEQARLVLCKEGLVWTDRYGQIRPRPEEAIARNQKILFARLIRELCLDDTPPPDDPRLPRLTGRRH